VQAHVRVERCPPAHVIEPERVFTIGFDYSSRRGEPAFMVPTSFPIFERILLLAPGDRAASTL
jgi:hypothetical protein